MAPGRALWRAITAWSVSPAFGSLAINGEYVAAPFVVWSMAASLSALRSSSDRRALVLGLLAGAAATAAVFVEQNHADGLVSGPVACLLAGRMLGTPTTRAVRVFASAVVGCTVTPAAIALGCLVRGTSPGGVIDAMYASRSAAAALQRQADLPPLLERSAEFRHVWIVSGLLLVMLVAAGVVALTVASSALVTPGAMFSGGGSNLSSRIGGAMQTSPSPTTASSSSTAGRRSSSTRGCARRTRTCSGSPPRCATRS